MKYVARFQSFFGDGFTIEFETKELAEVAITAWNLKHTSLGINGFAWWFQVRS